MDLLILGFIATMISVVVIRKIKKVRAQRAYVKWHRQELANQFDIYIESLRFGHFKKPNIK